MDSLLQARTDAEAGIERCDGLIREAQRAGSPLVAFLPLYIDKRRGFALAAARHAARLAREEAAL